MADFQWDAGSALDNWWSTLRRNAARLRDDLFPEISAAALEFGAYGLDSPAIPQLFSCDLREIEPSLNEDLLDLYARSEQALANRFNFLNQSLDFGEEIAWERHPSAHWRAELHAFDYALDLALTYRISREEHYARRLRYLIADWIASNPPLAGSGWQLSSLARRVRNWILASDLARHDWERDPGFLELFAKSLALQATCLYRQAESAADTRISLQYVSALQLAGRFFGAARGAKFRPLALAMLLRELERLEHPEAYQDLPRPSSLLALASAAMEFLVLSAPDTSTRIAFVPERLEPLLEMLEGVLLPGGNLPLLGPAPAYQDNTLDDLFALAAVWYNNPKWKVLANRFGIWPYMLLGEAGKRVYNQLPRPARKPEHSTGSPIAVYRISGEEGSAAVANGRPAHSPHDHQDFLSFELYVQGQRLLVDCGADAPEGEPEDEFFWSAAAHNVLLVDGRGSSPGAAPAKALFDSPPGLARFRISNAAFTALGLSHERAWFCLDGRTWAILDRIEGEGAHRATSLLHFYPTYEIAVQGNRAIAKSRALAVTIIPLGSLAGRMTVTRGEDEQFPGWYAPACGVKSQASVLVLDWSDVVSPWVGGYLIVPGTSAEFSLAEADTAKEALAFTLEGKHYRLEIK